MNATIVHDVIGAGSRDTEWSCGCWHHWSANHTQGGTCAYHVEHDDENPKDS